MGTREVYDYEQQKWVPYISDPDNWYQHLLDMRDGLVEPDYLGRYIVGSGEKHRRLKEMEAKQIEKQRPVVNLVSPVAQATEMARSEIKREREMAKSKTFVPPGRRKTSTDHSQRISCNTMVPFDQSEDRKVLLKITDQSEAMKELLK